METLCLKPMFWSINNKPCLSDNSVLFFVIVDYIYNIAPFFKNANYFFVKMLIWMGLEPSTPTVTGWYTNQLCYQTIKRYAEPTNTHNPFGLWRNRTDAFSKYFFYYTKLILQSDNFWFILFYFFNLVSRFTDFVIVIL